MKKLISLFLTTVMVLSVGLTGIFAEESGIKVTVDGKAISFEEAKPIYKNGRVMVPFASIFDALGAKVKYENGKIIGTLENKEIILSQDKNTAEFITAGKSEIINLDVPVFVEPKLNRAYVPVSAISLAFGYDVYWDNTSKVVNIIDSEKLINEINSKFTIMNKLSSYNKNYNDFNKTYKSKVDAMLDANVSKEISGEEENLTFVAGMALEAISKGLDMSVKGNIKIDPAKTNLTEYFGLSGDELKDIPFEVIFNADKNKLYLNSAIITDQVSTNSNVYYEIDLNESMGATNQILASISKGNDISIGEIVYKMAFEMKDTLSTIGMDVYNYIQETVKIYDVLISDDLFKVTTSGGKTTYEINMNKTEIVARFMNSYGMNGINADIKKSLDNISKVDYKLVFVEEKEVIINSKLLLDITANFEGDSIRMLIDSNSNNLNSDMKMNLSIMGVEINFDMKTAAMETSESVKKLPENATIIAMN